MAASRIQPPFAWLGPYRELAAIILVVGAGALFRFLMLGSLPPGLDGGSAALGLEAWGLAHGGHWPMPDVINGFAPLWVWLQALSVRLLGDGTLALRLWPATLGALSVLTTWLWIKAWFNGRVALIAAFLVAVTPWAITISRNAEVAALFPFLVGLTFWLAIRAYRSRTLPNTVLFAAAVVLDLLSGPVGWTILLALLLVSLKQIRKALEGQAVWAAVGVMALGVVGSALLFASLRSGLHNLPSYTGLVSSVPQFLSGLLQTLGMFNVTGDQNYRHNLAGEPMLNAFVGLMLVAGLLVSIGRVHERRYRAVVITTLVLLVPAVITTVGTPNGGRAAVAIPAILTLSAIGVSYMLELWYKTFPINSAARVSGQAAIVVLLALTMAQGYTQYFSAWAGTAAVYSAYDEGASQLAYQLRSDSQLASYHGNRFVVANADELGVVAYLTRGNIHYTALTPQQLASTSVPAGPKQLWITAAARDATVTVLKQKYAGGVLRPSYSRFNQAEIYYTYEVSQ